MIDEKSLLQNLGLLHGIDGAAERIASLPNDIVDFILSEFLLHIIF